MYKWKRISRVKNYTDFIIQPFSLDRLTKIKNSTSLKPRVNEEHRMKKNVEDTLMNYQFLL